MRFDHLAVCTEKLPAHALYYLKSTLQGYNFDLYCLGLLSSLPSFLQLSTVANKQGSIRGESETALTGPATVP
jgi:hypothetical protein